MKKNHYVVRTVLVLIVIFLLFYFQLPAINLRSQAFYGFMIEVIVACVIIYGAGRIKDIFTNKVEGPTRRQTIRMGLRTLGKPLLTCLGVVVVLFVITIIGNVIGVPLFHANAYANLVNVQEGNFTDDVSELSMSSIPVVDWDTASRLGKRKLGEMSDLVSQFEITEEYTQINYNNTPYRVTPLAYADVFKWFNNQKNGLPGYIMVNMVTQEASLVRFSDGEGMKYSKSEYFFRNIYRYIRMKYPTKIFDDISFEVADDGTPYWVAPVIRYRIGLWNGKDIGGAILVNALTGESEYYDVADVPSWIDQVYISDVIEEQLNYYGLYQNGFINSLIGQNGVLKTTEGYNYIAVDDDVYLYTGLTSVTSDQSNIGFVLVNLRTKEANYYAIPGAEEMSAMASAEGQVQNLKYSATFPILLNVADRPTYFLSLKDDAGLVKMYAFVDVEQYQVVATGSTVKAAMENYAEILSEETDTQIEVEEDGTSSEEEEEADLVQTSGTITAISSVVVDGNTCYYFLLDDDSAVYTAFISVSEQLPFLQTGDQVEVSYKEEGNTRSVTKLEVVSLPEELPDTSDDETEEGEIFPIEGDSGDGSDEVTVGESGVIPLD
jgi:hypothetical protein